MRRPLLLLVFAVLLPAPVSSQPLTLARDLFNFCTTDAVQVCSSAKISTVTSATGTDFVFRFRNDQGTNIYDTSAWSAMTYFNVRAVGPTPPLGSGLFQNKTDIFWSRPEGAVEEFGEQADLVDGWLGTPVSTRNFGFGLDYLDRYMTGCGRVDAQTEANAYLGHIGGYRMCGAEGLDGWVAFGFTSTEMFTVDDLVVEWGMTGRDTDGSVIGSGVCTSTPGATVDGCVQLSVPEPTGALLLLSGLVGLAWTARSRRRDAPAA